MTEPEFLLTWADLAIVFALLVSVVVVFEFLLVMKL